MIPQKLLDRIACPNCKSELSQEKSSLYCAPCGIHHPIAASGTLPVLFPKDSDFEAAQYANWERTATKGARKKGYREKRRLPQTNVTNMDSELRGRFFDHLQDGVILNLGSGQRSVHSGTQWVSLDICPHANCEIVGDAHQLPFQDNSFDGVHTISVFEHLKKPWLAAAEVARVLKPDGFLFCSVPFAYPIHGSPNDYFRYTAEGLRSLFDSLEPIEVTPGRGPVSSIGLYCERVADAVLPGKLGFVARWCTAWTIQPFKYLDPWLTKKNPDSATSFSIYAKKTSAVV